MLKLLTVVLLAAVSLPRAAEAHCDTLDGPVVKAGQQALDTGTIAHALAWVAPEHEAELTRAFERARKVRDLDDDARDLADQFFLETLVRLHREGEGEPYTGLKPAGEGHTRAIVSADRAVASGKLGATRKLLTRAVTKQLEHRFDAVRRHRKYRATDVDAAREYVAAYVAFIHYVEGIHRAVRAGGAHAAH
jgi:hypothetical protein